MISEMRVLVWQLREGRRPNWTAEIVGKGKEANRHDLINLYDEKFFEGRHVETHGKRLRGTYTGQYHAFPLSATFIDQELEVAIHWWIYAKIVIGLETHVAPLFD